MPPTCSSIIDSSVDDKLPPPLLCAPIDPGRFTSARLDTPNDSERRTPSSSCGDEVNPSPRQWKQHGELYAKLKQLANRGPPESIDVQRYFLASQQRGPSTTNNHQLGGYSCLLAASGKAVEPSVRLPLPKSSDAKVCIFPVGATDDGECRFCGDKLNDAGRCPRCDEPTPAPPPAGAGFGSSSGQCASLRRSDTPQGAVAGHTAANEAYAALQMEPQPFAAPTWMVTARSPVVDPPVTCTVCYEDIPKGDTNAKCPRGHVMCEKCFARSFDDSLSRSRDGLSSCEVTASRFMVKCATTDGCECYLSVKTTNAMLTEEQAERYEAINKELYKDLHRDEWSRQKAEQERAGAEAERAESLRAAFRDARGNYTVYQCPRCRFGPKQLAHCDDLAKHHGEEIRNQRTGKVYVRNNACEKCGYFAPDIEDWDRWDGTVWPVEDIPRGGSSVPAIELNPAESKLVEMGYPVEVIRQPNVQRRIAGVNGLQQRVEAALEALAPDVARTEGSPRAAAVRLPPLAAASAATLQQRHTSRGVRSTLEEFEEEDEILAGDDLSSGSTSGEDSDEDRFRIPGRG